MKHFGMYFCLTIVVLVHFLLLEIVDSKTKKFGYFIPFIKFTGEKHRVVLTFDRFGEELFDGELFFPLFGVKSSGQQEVSV